VVPFDQIYWNSGLPIADPGEYTSSSTKVAKIGQTANRNPDSTFSFPGGKTTDQEVDEWFGPKANKESVNNIFVGIHVTDPLTISPDKPYKGARLVLKRNAFKYHDIAGTCDNWTKTTDKTQAFGFQHIKVKKNGVVQRPAEHGTLVNASLATQTRFGDINPEYVKYDWGTTYSVDGSVGTNSLTLYADYGSGWDTVPPHYIINKDFLLVIDGTTYTISSITRTGTFVDTTTFTMGYTYSINTNESLSSTYTKETDFVIWEKRGSPRVDSVVHVEDSDDTTDGTNNASSSSDFNDYNGDGMSESTWGMLPYKYDELDVVEDLPELIPAFENVTQAVFGAWSGPSYSAGHTDYGTDSIADTKSLSYQQKESPHESDVWYKVLSTVSQAAWPEYENNIAALTDTIGGTRSGGIIGNRYGEVAYQGIPGNGAWDRVYEANRENRVDQNNLNAQSNRNIYKYPYVLGNAGFYRANDANDPPVLGQDPLFFEDPHYLTIWETDEIITPGDTYEVTLTGPLRAETVNWCPFPTPEDRTTRTDFSLVLIAK